MPLLAYIPPLHRHPSSCSEMAHVQLPGIQRAILLMHTERNFQLSAGSGGLTGLKSSRTVLLLPESDLQSKGWRESITLLSPGTCYGQSEQVTQGQQISPAAESDFLASSHSCECLQFGICRIIAERKTSIGRTASGAVASHSLNAFGSWSKLRRQRLLYLADLCFYYYHH